MRDQLHLMELVDNYLDGTMNPTDRTAFEERLRNSEELRSLVEDQQRLRQAARRSPARAAAKKAYRNYRWGKSLRGMGTGAVVLIAATAALFLWKSPMADGGPENAPVSESEYRTLTDTTGTHLDPLVLTIDPKKDTTLVTPNGIVLDIPQGAFVDSLGAAITTPVRVTLLEALDPLDIMKAGLSTMSGDTLLETGGMFYLDAQANGKPVKIDPAKPLTAMVPADKEEKRKRGSAEVPEARVRHILFSTQGRSEEEQAKVKSLADSLLAVVRRDKSKFEAMVEKYTEDPGSKSTGGVYDWFDKSRMVPEFATASFDQPVGSITMCKTSYGYHIVEVLDLRVRTISAPPLNDGEMMLYQGVKSPDGTIDWRNPQPLKKSLVPVDITTLNFYPPGYEAKLAELGQDVTHKAFKDSLYYSFESDFSRTDDRWAWPYEQREFAEGNTTYSPAAWGQHLFLQHCSSCHKGNTDMTGPALKNAKLRWEGRGNIFDYVRNSQAVIKSGNPYANELHVRWNKSVMTSVDLSDVDIDAIFRWVDAAVGPQDGIDPAKIKTIWNARFNNTNLATKEFEKRLAYIFRTCDNALLDVYVNNLDKDLYWCDSVATRMHPEPMSMFLQPAFGRVKLPAHAADRLRTFYENNSRAEAEAIRKTQEKFWNEQWKQDVKSDTKRADHATAEGVREGALFQKELAANLDTVYKQLGYTRVQLPRAAWVVPVNNTGWWNVDKAVIQATTTRSSMKYADDKTGKTATLTYTPLIVEVADRTSYDELVVYLIPNQLNSYQRMKEGTGGFTERLNSIFTYDLFCLAMKGKEQFAFETLASGQAEIKAALTPVAEEALRRMLKSASKVQQELVEEAKHFEWLMGDKQRRRSNADKQALRAALLPVVFPCQSEEGSPATPDPSRSSMITVADAPAVVAVGGASGVAPLATVDQAPEFPGGTVAFQRYLTTSIRYPDELIDRGIGGKVYVQFVLDENGDVERADVISGVHPKLDAEALRVVRKMPRWKAASDRGSFIRTQLTIPIEFRAQ